MRDLLHSDSPAQGIAAVIERGSREGATMFERYAASVLRAAGGERLVHSAQAQRLKVIEPENGQLAHLVQAGPGSYPTTSTLLSTECALNRLVCLCDAVADGIDENDPPQTGLRRSISILGGGFIRTGVGFRSARVELPTIASASDISLDYYHELDWRCTDNVASNGRAVFQRSMKPNTYRSTLGVDVRTQSDWDVRTRLAQILRALELPFRYSFRFDYDDASKAVSVVFTCPPASFLPEIAQGQEDAAGPLLQRAYECYLLRLTCLFGCASFGSGKKIERATVAGYTASWGKPLVVAQFDRASFVQSVLVAIDSNEIASPSLRFKPAELAQLIGAGHLDWVGRAPEHETQQIEVPRDDAPMSRMEPWLDERELPAEAQELFHCERICDIDTEHYSGGHAAAIDLARGDADESSLAAIMRLESLVEELEAGTAAPEGTDARPLYAADPLSRLAVVLLDDELAVSAQAEAFLQGDIEALPEEGERPRYYRAPSALFHARFGLSDLYQRRGDFHAAELQADRCIALAPTTASAYYRKADVLAEQGLFAQAANVLIDGLRCCAVSADCALLYYHLGMLLWNSGRADEATAVHAYNATLDGEYAAKSRQVLNGMRENGDVHVAAGTSAFNAARELERLRLPVSPVDIGQYVTQATILLANAGNAQAAAPYARELERHSGKDEVIVAACRSIQFGIDL